MSKAVVIFSGGQDSTTCLLRSLKEDDETLALTFDYGQKNKVEIESAENICNILGVKFVTIDVSELFHTISSTPYLDKSGVLGGKSNLDNSLPATWVPNRNMLFITIAYSYAIKIGYDKVVTGVNAVDYSGYPDCRPEFIKSLRETLKKSVPPANVEIETPLLYLSKVEIWKMAHDLGGFELVRQFTHTCYNGDHKTKNDWGYGCGECDSCKIRKGSYNKFIESIAVRNPSD